MTPLWSAAEIAGATGGVASSDFAATGVTFDSREVGAGDLFLALKGEHSDGHRYVGEAFARGAAGAIVSQSIEQPHILVGDTTAALRQLGAAARARTAAKVIGVTGSVGKTGTKEALFACLDRFAPGQTHRSVKSYNNHTGVPLSLARMPTDTRFGVFEMGMNHAGEIADLTRQVQPDVAIVTTIAPAHIENFADEGGIADAKAEIFAGLQSAGTAILPGDSVHLPRLLAAAKARTPNVLLVGSRPEHDVYPLEVVASSASTYVNARVRDRELSFTLGQKGPHWVSNALMVLAAVDAVGGDLALAGLALADLGGLAGRGQRLTVRVDGGDALVIDESYNANPASMRATLAVLAAEPADRRLAVLGEMKELGARAPEYHAALAEPVLAAGVEAAILVGEPMADLAKALEGKVEIVHVPDAAAARDSLRAMLAPGDAVLIKGSNGVGLAAVVRALASEEP